MGYYQDKEKITFDGADRIVEDYLAEVSDAKETVCASRILEAVGIEDSHHNVIRMTEALSNRLDVAVERNRSQTLYSLSERVE